MSTTTNPPLPFGYSPIPAGKIVNAVTCLEMLAPPPARPDPASATSLRLDRWHQPASDEYRALYRRVGEDWMWFSRLILPEDNLRAILDDPKVEVSVLRDGDKDLGLLELDFREDGQCELAFFGLVPEAIGNGAGRFMMNRALASAWSRPITRFWVHTCHFDHPGAPVFYQRSGFRPYTMMVEVCDDPRLSGIIPRTASPHVPLIESNA